MTLPNNGNSMNKQNIEIKVAYLPTGIGDAYYRVSIQNDSTKRWTVYRAQNKLDLGFNYINIPNVSFKRTVIVDFASGEVKFNYIKLNNELICKFG